MQQNTELKSRATSRWEAAYWYRAAIDNGLSPIGLSWVYKVSFACEPDSGGTVLISWLFY
jgi:hypothetical protein